MTGLWALAAGCIAAAYIVGSLPMGLWVGRTRGIDIRTIGSGNIGATNVYRALGLGPALVVFAADVIKGWGPVRAGMVFLTPALARGGLSGEAAQAWVVPIALAAIVGHSFSVFLRFRGGRGVATTLGVLLALSPWAALGALCVWIVVMVALRIVSVGSILAAASVPLFMWRLHEPRPFFYFASAVAALVIVRHAPNIRRLARGEEKRISRLSAAPPQEPDQP